MGWFSTMLGTNGVVDGIREGVDKAILTPEERLDYHKELMKSYEPFKLIQRMLAFITSILFAIVAIVEIVLVLIGMKFPIAVETAMIINKLEVVSMICWGWVTVMGLYFTGGAINTFFGNKKGK